MSCGDRNLAKIWDFLCKSAKKLGTDCVISSFFVDLSKKRESGKWSILSQKFRA